jgi:predicted dinucleotide-binding enzyme
MSSIGVIGSGNVGTTVGEAWRDKGHEVAFGSRSPEPPRTVRIADAIAGADVVLLALPGGAVPQFSR